MRTHYSSKIIVRYILYILSLHSCRTIVMSTLPNAESPNGSNPIQGKDGGPTPTSPENAKASSERNLTAEPSETDTLIINKANEVSVSERKGSR